MNTHSNTKLLAVPIAYSYPASHILVHGLPPAFHSLKHLRFSLTASSTWLFHHQVCFLHGWFEETPHTCFVACKSLSFSEVQRSSTVLVCDSSLSSVLALNTSESSACFSGSLSFLTLMCGTNLRLGWGGMETLNSPTSSLCCDAHSSPSMTFTLATCFLKLRRYRMVYLGSSIPRLVGVQVFRFLLEPCVPDNKFVSKCKL